MRALIPVLVVAVIVGLVTGIVLRARRRRKADATLELHRHPERLDQMLDPTDDA